MTLGIRTLVFIIAVILFLYNSIHCQVNTETLRKSDLAQGFHNTAQLDLGMVSGNSEFLKLKTGFRTDYISKKYYAFMVIQYQRGTKNQNKFINKGFIHLRNIRRFTERFRGELFAQKEFDDFILLKDRNLIGGGIRTELVSRNTDKKNYRFFIGNGIMWENEKIRTSPVSETRIVRSTNYVSLQLHNKNRWNINFVSYYQLNLESVEDYRILMDSTFGFKLSNSFSFRTNFNYRYDNEPPPNIKKYDLELTNGISFSF